MRGVLYVINKCRKPTPHLINLTKCLEIELHKNKWLCKEQETLGHIMQAFNSGESLVLENTGLTYIFQGVNCLLNAMSLTIVIETLDTM